MEWSLRGSLNSDMEIESADYPNIRFYRMPHIARPQTQDDVDLVDAGNGQGVWRQCIAEHVQCLEVWCNALPEPVAVRYAVSNLPIGGLENSRQLPAYPFRTDNWPITPHQSTGDYEVDKTGLKQQFAPRACREPLRYESPPDRAATCRRGAARVRDGTICLF